MFAWQFKARLKVGRKQESQWKARNKWWCKIKINFSVVQQLPKVILPEFENFVTDFHQSVTDPWQCLVLSPPAWPLSRPAQGLSRPALGVLPPVITSASIKLAVTGERFYRHGDRKNKFGPPTIKGPTLRSIISTTINQIASGLWPLRSAYRT